MLLGTALAQQRFTQSCVAAYTAFPIACTSSRRLMFIKAAKMAWRVKQRAHGETPSGSRLRNIVVEHGETPSWFCKSSNLISCLCQLILWHEHSIHKCLGGPSNAVPQLSLTALVAQLTQSCLQVLHLAREVLGFLPGMPCNSTCISARMTCSAV